VDGRNAAHCAWPPAVLREGTRPDVRGSRAQRVCQNDAGARLGAVPVQAPITRERRQRRLGRAPNTTPAFLRQTSARITLSPRSPWTRCGRPRGPFSECRFSVPIRGVNLGSDVCPKGGSWAWWSGRVWCVRAPGLISVRDPRFGVGDVMVDGVFPRGDALRPLGLWRPSTRTWWQQHAGSWPRCIGVRKGCARTDRRGQAGCRAWSPSSRRTWKLRLSSLRASARQARLPPSRSAAWS
jgi:hypothetical protein